MEGQETSEGARDADHHRELTEPLPGHSRGLRQIDNVSQRPSTPRVPCPVLHLSPNLCHKTVSPNVLEEMST